MTRLVTSIVNYSYDVIIMNCAHWFMTVVLVFIAFQFNSDWYQFSSVITALAFSRAVVRRLSLLYSSNSQAQSVVQ